MTFKEWVATHPLVSLLGAVTVGGVAVAVIGGLVAAKPALAATGGGAGGSSSPPSTGGLPNGGTVGGPSSGLLAQFPAGSVGVSASADNGKAITLPPGGSVVVLLPNSNVWASSTPSIGGSYMGRSYLAFSFTAPTTLTLTLIESSPTGHQLSVTTFYVRVVAGASPSVV